MRNHSLLVKSIGSFVIFTGKGAVAQDVPIVRSGTIGESTQSPGKPGRFRRSFAFSLR